MSERWEIAVDLTPGKVNGDQLVQPNQRLKRDWWAMHPNAWRIVEVVPALHLREVEERAKILSDALDEIVDDLSVPHRPPPWAAHALQVAQMALEAAALASIGGEQPQVKASDETPSVPPAGADVVETGPSRAWGKYPFDGLPGGEQG